VNRGSSDITKNISQSMRIPFLEAEKLKRSVGLEGNTDREVQDIIKLSTDYIFSNTKKCCISL